MLTNTKRYDILKRFRLWALALLVLTPFFSLVAAPSAQARTTIQDTYRFSIPFKVDRPALNNNSVAGENVTPLGIYWGTGQMQDRAHRDGIIRIIAINQDTKQVTDLNRLYNDSEQRLEIYTPLANGTYTIKVLYDDLQNPRLAEEVNTFGTYCGYPNAQQANEATGFNGWGVYDEAFEGQRTNLCANDSWKYPRFVPTPTVAETSDVRITDIRGRDLPAASYGITLTPSSDTTPDEFDESGATIQGPERGVDPDTDGESTCNIAGVGWIVCPAAHFIGWLTDVAYAAVETLLVFQVPNALNTGPDNTLYQVWNNVRNLANIAFIFAFFIIIFSQSTSMGIGSYGIKKMLPRLIVAAIMVNLSYFLCIFAIDISNIIGAGIDGILTSALNEIDGGNQPASWEGAITSALLIGGVAAGGAAVAIGSSGVLIALAVPLVIGALFAILTALVILIARQAILTILIVVAPLAFVAYILPNTEKFFDKWRGIFITMLIFYPLVALLFSGAQVAAEIIRSTSQSGFVDLISLGVQAFPLFGVPFILKFSGGLLGRIGGVVNNPNKGPFDALRKRGMDYADYKKENHKGRALDGKTNRLASRFARSGARRDSKYESAKTRKSEASQFYTGSLLQPGEDGMPADSKFASQMAGFSRKEAKNFSNLNEAHKDQQKMREGDWARQDQAMGYGDNVAGTQDRIREAEKAQNAYNSGRTISSATESVGEVNLNKAVKVIARGQAVVDEIETKDLKAAQLLQTNLRMSGGGLKEILNKDIGETVKGMSGESIIVTEAAKAAAGATMLSQAREVDTVLTAVSKLKDKKLRSFIVGGVGSNFTPIKAKQAGATDEKFQQQIINGELTSDAAFNDAYVQATARKVETLNLQNYASQESVSVKAIEKGLNNNIITGSLAAQLRKFSAEAQDIPTIQQFVPQDANEVHGRIAGPSSSRQSPGNQQQPAPQGNQQQSPGNQQQPAPQGNQQQSPLSPRTDKAMRRLFERFSDQDILGMGAGGVNVYISNVGGVSGLSDQDVSRLRRVLGDAGVRTQDQQTLFNAVNAEAETRAADEPQPPIPGL